MKNTIVTLCGILLFSTLLHGCDKLKFDDKPQIEDINSVGCLITNDFYAVHFSAYLKSSGGNDRDALLRPYCQDIPGVGKAFFAADLIDRDIRKTPIGVRVVEVQKTGSKPDDFTELRTIAEFPAKLYPRGVVEAQADIDKNGDYVLVLIVGGEDALAEEDKLKIPFTVGGNMFGLSTEWLIALAAGWVLVVAVVIFQVVLLRKRRKANKIAAAQQD
ncbi:MAG: hypothetical protein Q8Q40_00225 [Methylococcaceae bacterium]|nr:hypothetical protein [Methylococcaceae bacterium]MDP3902385.1 hypothetical protein [Methylococcaceae bacterium]